MAKVHVFALSGVGLLSAVLCGCGRERSGQSDPRPGSSHAIASGQEGAPAAPAPTSSVVTTRVPEVPDPLKGLDSDMGEVLTELQRLEPQPIPTLTAAEARKQPTPADAVKALLKKQGKPVAPEAVAKVHDRIIPTAGGAKLPVRVYTPQGDGALPIIVYYHGGGFALATNDAYDATPRALANGAKAIVVSVEYRKAPEHKFPTAHDDAFAAYRWVVKNAASIGGDPPRIAVAGESAGANLAANVAIAARDQKERQPVHLLLVYPVAGSAMTTESYAKYRDAKPLDKAMMVWFTEQYFRTSADAQDPRMDLVNAKLTGLPAATIINAEIDPLRSDGELLARRLKAAEVPVEQKTFAGVTHEFFGMGAAVADAKDAMELATDRLKKSFEIAPATARRDIDAP